MTTLIVATDGSELAIGAGVAGLSLTRPPDKVIVATVAEVLDPSLVEDATGHAAASMRPDEFEAHNREVVAESRSALDTTIEALRRAQTGPDDFDARVIEGEPGPALCRLAAEVDASALIIGSRGRGGIKRALLGSVSDHVVRNAPCSVIVSRKG